VPTPVEKSVVQTDFVGIFDGIDDWTSHTEGGMVGIRTRVVEEREKKRNVDGTRKCERANTVVVSLGNFSPSLAWRSPPCDTKWHSSAVLKAESKFRRSFFASNSEKARAKESK
jgi:hypothetical protein